MTKPNTTPKADTTTTPAQDTTPAGPALAVLAPTTASTPARRGDSTIAMPVATVWLHCFNTGLAKGAAPARKVLVAECVGLGVAYYTARTQVDAYLRATKGNTVRPDKTPKGLVLPL
jgi:hypothetical protein